MDNHDNRTGWIRVKCLVAVVVGTVGLGAIFYSSGISTETSKKKPLPPADSQTQKPVRAMHLALGPMVFFARELDFAVKNAKGESLDDSRIAARIESQLQGLRELYRREIAKNPKLVGSVISQFSVDPAGQVQQVKEIRSRLDNAEFRQTVAAEIGKWTFTELVAQPLTVQLPLLFVEEGMDITTLLRWESSVAGAQEKVAASAAAKPETTKRAKAAAAAKPAAAREKSASPTIKTAVEEVETKYAALLRKEPNFAAPVLTTFTTGTKVTVLNRSSDWLEVRSQHNGPSGYIRKEFVTPIDVVVKR